MATHRVLARVLPHRLDDDAQQRGTTLDEIRQRRARQMHTISLEDPLLSMQGAWSQYFCVITCAMRPGPATEREMGRSGSSAITIGELPEVVAGLRYLGRTTRTRTTLAGR